MAATKADGPTQRRSRKAGGPVQATPPTPAQWNVPDEIIETIVKRVTDRVTECLAPTAQPAAVSGASSLREAPIVGVTPPTLASPNPDTLVTNAVRTAQSAISGMPSEGTSTLPEMPTTVFTSPSLAIGARVSDKIKAKIWNNEYFDISLLLKNPVLEDKFQLSVRNTQGSPSISLEPVSKPKKFLSIESWLQCFHIFVGVYCRKFPHEAPALMKYGEVVQDLAARGHNWKFYDENFRFLRQSQTVSFRWDCIHWELWMRSHQSPSPKVSQSSVKSRSDKKPFGYCFKFSKGMDCSGCVYKHLCHKCEGSHFPKNCSFRGQKSSKQNNQAPKVQQSNTHPK